MNTSFVATTTFLTTSLPQPHCLTASFLAATACLTSSFLAATTCLTTENICSDTFFTAPNVCSHICGGPQSMCSHTFRGPKTCAHTHTLFELFLRSRRLCEQVLVPLAGSQMVSPCEAIHSRPQCGNSTKLCPFSKCTTQAAVTMRNTSYFWVRFAPLSVVCSTSLYPKC